MRITVFVVTAVIELATATVGLFILLLGLNGYSESQATPSLIFYIVFCVISSLALSFLGTLAAKAIVKKGWLGKPAAAIVSIVFASALGDVLLVLAVFLAFILAELLRGMR